MDDSAKRVAVTGAGGFIGRRLCERLSQEGFSPVGVDLDASRAEGIRDAGAEFRQADTTHAGAIAEALSDCPLVAHTAAIVAEWGDMDEFVRVNVGGTRNVLDAAEAAGAARVVHVSSIAVWGCEFRREMHEDDWPHPYGNPYVDTKGASEVIARRRGAVVVRPGDVYGPRSVPWALRPLEGVRSGQVRLPAGGEGVMTPVYVDDLVDALFRALTVEGARGPYTAWDGQPVPTGEFFSYFARMLGEDEVPTAPMPLMRVAAAAMERVARLTGKPPAATQFALDYIGLRTHAYSTRRAREELGWEPKVTLDEGMRRTEEWFRAEGLLPAAA